ncbi:hypothetical protein METHB2_390001 [Candidatus Methylobacter favarea]|uniref:Uncharacterized protein n=1 Tax=Candidatus Methylobacter favarea TaxID=2707345 RepID=A0A8S0XGR7_9GAMM|nr:hypothetical protein [Candidatus Methylobacter favarea]CAA9891267.1 hypothetical protein METHB2_390001 [Candidatus Methylobacter favarea]
MRITWDSKIKTSVKRGNLAYLFRKNNLLDEFIKNHWQEGREERGITNLKFIEKIKEDYEVFWVNEDDDPDEDEQNDPISQVIEMMNKIMENHLR